MSNTYPELYFPPNPKKGDEYLQKNGLTYIYNDEKETWEIKLDSFVSEGLLYSELARRVSRYGDSMTGSLFLKADLSATAPRMGAFGFDLLDDNKTYKSYLKLDNKNATIYFTDTKNDAHIYKGGKKFITFKGDTKIELHKRIELASTVEDPLFYSKLAGQFVLHKVDNTPDEATVQTGVQLTNSSKSLFGVLNRSNVARFTVSGVGATKVSSDSSFALIVQRTNNPYGGVEDDTYTDKRNVFTVNSVSLRVRAHKEFDKALRAGLKGNSYVIEKPDGNTQSYKMDDDELVATLGYVKDSKFHPGEKIAADSEADAEVGGFWMDGTKRLWIKVS